MLQEGARVYPAGSPPSAIKGWLKRVGGTIIFNRRVRREGKDEISAAHQYREYKRARRRERRGHSRHRHGDRYEADRRYQSESRHPFLKFPHRCRPPYHGAHFRLWGFLTRRRDHISRGLSMAEEAERERRRERRRRLRRLEAEGLAIRMGAKTVIHERSHRHRSRSHGHHRSHNDGSRPIVMTADVGQGGQVYPVTTQTIPVTRSTNVQVHHRHHSSNSTTVPLIRTSSSHYGHGHHRSRSRSYSGTTTPIVPVANSHYTNGSGLPVAVSSRHGHGHYDTGDHAIPVMRSSSRHGSSRYGDPAFSRASSSRHHRHRSQGHHTRAPAEVYVSA